MFVLAPAIPPAIVIFGKDGKAIVRSRMGIRGRMTHLPVNSSGKENEHDRDNKVNLLSTRQ